MMNLDKLALDLSIMLGIEADLEKTVSLNSWKSLLEGNPTMSRACATLSCNSSQNDSPSITCCLAQKRQFVARMWVLRAIKYCFRKFDRSSKIYTLSLHDALPTGRRG